MSSHERWQSRLLSDEGNPQSNWRCLLFSQNQNTQIDTTVCGPQGTTFQPPVSYDSLCPRFVMP